MGFIYVAMVFYRNTTSDRVDQMAQASYRTIGESSRLKMKYLSM